MTSPPQLPTAARVADWLAAHGRPRPAHVGTPQPVPSAFFRRHVLFTVSAGRSVLPFVSLPAGSWGLFAHGDGGDGDGDGDGRDGGLALLSPGDGSFEELLRREARPLHEADPAELAQLLCDARLPRPPAHRHVVIAGAADLESFSGGPWDGYRVDAGQLRRARASIEPPAITALDEGGWSITFTTVTGWMHELQNLGLESIWAEPDFSLNVGERRVLSRQIFEQMPALRY